MTKHNHGPNFGKRVKGCARCEELAAGAPAIQWNISARKRSEAQHIAEIHAHFTSEKHLSGGCGPVCTFGEW